MTETADQTQKEWCPLVGQRVFKSANQAWEIYGQYRFSVSQRTFNTYVGKNKLCPPRSDGSYYVEDIEIIAESKGWAPTSSFVRGAQQGGEGEAAAYNSDIGAEIQKEKLLKARLEREDLEIDIAKKRKELLPVKDYEQRLAAAAAIVGNEAETFVYDNVREIIHLCGGKPEKEDSLREYLLEKVRGWLHGFSRPVSWELEFTEDVLHPDEPEFRPEELAPVPAGETGPAEETA